MDRSTEKPQPFIPPWLVTYADLMTLLLCFFVLLLSFSQIDAIRFERLAGELAKAFGVQREVPADRIPMGTSPVFERFSPARPEPTVLEEVRQTTADEQPRHDTFRERGQDSRMRQRVARVATTLGASLEKQISQGLMQVETERDRVVVRIEEKGTFPSGSAKVLAPFEEMLVEMADVFQSIPGIIAVDGHTDNVPILSERFQSNWDLSAARAAAVANMLLDNQAFDPARIVVRGFADTKPYTDNLTPASRARNRRVEITIDLGDTIHEQPRESAGRLDPQGAIPYEPLPFQALAPNPP